MLASRKLDLLEMMFASSPCWIQLSIELEDERYVPQFVESLQKSLPGLRMKMNADEIIIHNKEQPILQIPKEIKKLNEVSNWHCINHTPSIHEVLASIAVRDNIISINHNHVCSDGTYLKNIVEKIVDQIGKNLRSNNEADLKNLLPQSGFAAFKQSVDNQMNSIYYFYNEDPFISRIMPHRPIQPSHQTGIYELFESKISDLAIVKNSKDGKVKGMTESLWASIILSIEAFNQYNNKTSMGHGASTVVSLRPYLSGKFAEFNEKFPWHVGYQCSAIRTSTDGPLNMNDKISDITGKMRSQLMSKIQQGEQFKFMAATRRLQSGMFYPQQPGLGIELSNVGPVRIKRPIKDFYMGSLGPADAAGGCCLFTYSTICEDHSHDKIRTQLLYSDRDMNPIDAKLVAGAIDFALREIGPENSVGDSIEILKQYIKENE
ncbi:hypothetical protein TRFO_31726 [Tritrichomonas foetus]|uniref:Condensation domain-containing protein n=1 Tax=Tritrichomonas foetus TaxID=1144522 RepID=A0A1J4JR02_9EUKA|nr:hypothetical protein TRFO_31726 [Tritrichomonas foetus]|eukprot:OHT01459.1 hypothetical protein TRFO_31726 [Tritrichomonas foetus]